MELLERYLQAVRTYLIHRRRDDIVKEQSDNMIEVKRLVSRHRMTTPLTQHSNGIL